MTAMKDRMMTDGNTPPTRRRMSPRQRRYWTSLGIGGVVGGIVGAWMVIDQPDGRSAFEMANTGPLSAGFAIGASIFWTLGVAIASIVYHRSIDDHEEHAWLWAGLWGWYAFIFTAPVWWVLHRAGQLPAPDVMILFIVSMLANGVAYLWLKFR